MWVIWTPFIRQRLAVTKFKFICSIKSLSPPPPNPFQVPEPLKEADTRFPFENVLFEHFYSPLLFSGLQPLRGRGVGGGGRHFCAEIKAAPCIHTLVQIMYL